MMSYLKRTLLVRVIFFFFQAEDGIRDVAVTEFRRVLFRSLLAEQHLATLTWLLAPLELKPDLLIGRLSAAEKAAARERIAAGASRVIVGTHALIQDRKSVV